MVKRSNNLWNDIELQSAVEAYLYVLRLQQAGLTYSIHDLATFLLNGPLKSRNDGSIRYRMRNISWVLQTLGWPTISAYSPATQVGSGVKSRIETLVKRRLDVEPLMHKRNQKVPKKPQDNQSIQELRDDALTHLEQLHKVLGGIEAKLIGIGHNQPPEMIDDLPMNSRELVTAKEDVEAIQNEINLSSPNIKKIKARKNRLLTFGLKFAVWMGGRFTKFSDAAMISLGTLLAAKAGNAGPLIVDTMEAVAKFIKHLESII